MGILEGVGFTISRSPKTAHWRARSPSGKTFGFSGTPSDYRAIKNFRSELRRGGYDIKILKAQLKRAIIEDRAIRLHTQPAEYFEKLIVHKPPPSKPRRSIEEIQAHRREMREMY